MPISIEVQAYEDGSLLLHLGAASIAIAVDDVDRVIQALHRGAAAARTSKHLTAHGRLGVTE